MANLHLVTGYAGEEHITSDDQGSFNAAIMGTGEFILERGKQFEASIISNNKVRVLDGDALMQGRHIRMKENTYVDLNFDNGLQGYNRIDLIVIRYSKDPATDIEKANLVVIKGTPVEGDPVAPDHITGDIINEHDLENDTVLYKVPFIGLNIQPLEKVFSTVPTWETLKKQVINNITTKFDALVAEAMQQIADGQKPLVSNIDDMLLIENYGEYGADAKAVGEEFNKINGNLEALGESGANSVSIISDGAALGTGVWQSACYITLPPGKWLIFGQANLINRGSNSKTTLYQQIIVETSANTYKNVAADALGVMQRNNQIIGFVHLETRASVYLQVYSNVAESYIHSKNISAIKIG